MTNPQANAAITPSEGVYYLVPQKDKTLKLLSLRADDHNEKDPSHFEFWKVYVKDLIIKTFNIKDPGDIYRSIPRGRIQFEYQDGEAIGYLVAHGNDYPKTFNPHILQDFGLVKLNYDKKVRFVHDTHEDMNPHEKEHLQKLIGVKW